MSNLFIILKQLLIMFLFMLVGFLLYKNKKIDNEGSKSIANLLIYIVLPCSILTSYINNNMEIPSKLFLASIALSLLCLMISILISSLLFKDKAIDNFGVSFSNAGFMGIPIITSVLDEKYLIYASGYIALLNILQYFYGQKLLLGETILKNKLDMIKNPLVISFFIGVTIYTFQYQVSDVFNSFIKSLASINSPLAMILLGTYIAQVRGVSSFLNKNLVISSMVRLLIIPITTIFIFKVLNVNKEIILPLIICVSAPVGSNLAVYAQKLDKDYIYSVELVSVSTVLYLATMPIILQLADLILV
ncbi:permease [Peptoniphilus sp. AGMB00490]|uniref:Permease n=1 Tax=Peptoniphilus faecalis TaxID=2731255 RepID=A0A848RJR3_9FIRM|nr:AEC family transporter [Peptoniphilus faecalis]NMW85723.1 permease [Peptoniphilus faecalis]